MKDLHRCTQEIAACQVAWLLKRGWTDSGRVVDAQKDRDRSQERTVRLPDDGSLFENGRRRLPGSQSSPWE